MEKMVGATENKDFNILEYLVLLTKHYKLILGVCLIAVLISLTIFVLKPRLYKSTAIIKFDPLHQDSLDVSSTSQLNYAHVYLRTEFLNTEFEVMKSNPVLDRLITDLTPAFFEDNFTQKKRSRNIFSIFFEKDDDKISVSPEELAIQKNKTAKRILLNGFHVRGGSQNFLVEVSFISLSPTISRTVAGAWVDAYIEHELAVDYTRNQQAMKFLQTSMEELRMETQGLVRIKKKLEEDNNIIKLGNNSSVGDETVSKLNQTKIQAETDLYATLARLSKLKKSGYIDSIEVNESPQVLNLDREISEKQSEYDRNLLTFKSQHRPMVELKQDIEAKKQELDKRRKKVYETLVTSLTAEIESRQSALAQMESRLDETTKSSHKSQGELETEISSLEGAITVNRKMMELLSTKEKGFDISSQLKNYKRSDKVVVEPASTPGSPFSPSLKRHLAIGFFLGFFVAIATVFVREITDRKIHNLEILEKVSGLPNLTLVPNIQDKKLAAAGRKCKMATLRDVLKHINQIQAQEPAHTEIGQIEKIARQGLAEVENSPDEKKQIEILNLCLGKIRDLAEISLHNGARSEKLRQLSLASTYAKRLGVTDEHNASKSAKKSASAKKRRKPKAGKDQADIAYGDTGNDIKNWVRMVVGCYTHIASASPFAEAYRHLRTNIQLSNTKQANILLMTSSVPGEGKTISSINLAVAFSQLNKKVLLIDGDLRRSKLHKVFCLDNKLGIVNYLVGDPSDLKACIQKTFIENLDLMSAGPAPPNPAELLASGKMMTLCEELRAKYDFVIFDSPPVLAVTDSCIIGNLVDATIFVSKGGVTVRDEAQHALQTLKANNITPIGTLFNDFNRGRSYAYGYSPFGYRGYGYGYGYGYKAEGA